MHSLIPEILAHRTGYIGCYILHWSRLTCRCSNNDSVRHCAILFEIIHQADNSRPSLTDGTIDADNISAFLIDNCIHHDGGFAYLPVTDDKLSLSPSNGNHGIYCFNACLERLVEWLPSYDTRRYNIHFSCLFCGYWGLPIYRPSDGIHNPAYQCFTNRRFHDLSCTLRNITFLNESVFTEQNCSNSVLFKVQDHSNDIV